ALLRGAVELAVARLDQGRLGRAAGGPAVEVLQHGEARSVGLDLEDGAQDVGPERVADERRSVERAVRALQQSCVRGGAGRHTVEVEENREAAPVGIELEDRAAAEEPAVDGGSIEHAVGGFEEFGLGEGAGRGLVEILENGESAPVRVQAEDRAEAG